jgi:hypothetical protein
MALYYELPVFKDVYKLTLLIYSLTKDFSKEYKYTLGQDLKRDVMERTYLLFQDLIQKILRLNKKFGISGLVKLKKLVRNYN